MYLLILIALPILCLDALPTQAPDRMACSRRCLETLRQQVDETLVNPVLALHMNTSYDEARQTFMAGCNTVKQSTECFAKCPAGTQVNNQLFRNKPFMLICVEKLYSWQEHVLKCEIEHRQVFVDECTEELLKDSAKQQQNIQELIGEIVAEPMIFGRPEVRDRFKEFCDTTTRVILCIKRAAGLACSQKGQRLIHDAFNASVSAADELSMARVAPACERMVETARGQWDASHGDD